MKILADLSISSKLAAVFASILLVVTALGVLSVVRIGMVNGAGAAIRDNWLPGVQLAGEIIDAANGYRQAEASLVLSSEEDALGEYQKKMNLEVARILGAQETLRKLPTSAEEAGYIEGFGKFWGTYLASSKQLVGFVTKKQSADAAELLTGDSAYQFEKAKSFMDRILNAKVKGGGESVTESDATYRSTVPVMLGAIVVAALICLGAAFGVVVLVARPIRRVTGIVGEMAAGNLDVAIFGADRKDEIGALANAIIVFKESASRNRELEAVQAAESESSKKRYEALEIVTQKFNTVVSGQLKGLAEASVALEQTAGGLSSRADATMAGADRVQQDASVATQSAQAVATAAKQFAGASGEIAEQVARTTGTTGEAVQQSRRATKIVQELSQVVEGVTQVVGFINNIAAQTNLLALNATIEAARAGAAGKGFAVVAQEVKQLANQTAKATDDISTRIQAVQTSALDVTEIIRSIGDIIAKIDDNSGTIAAAVTEQGAAAAEMSRNISETTARTTDVGLSIADVRESAEFTKITSAQLYGSSASLSEQADKLREEVEYFLGQMAMAGDRRRYARCVMNQPVEIEAPGLTPSEPFRLLPAHLENLSEGGAALRSTTELPTGTAIRLLNLGTDGIPATVVVSANGLLRIQFRMNAATQATLAALLTKHAA